jgi:glycosyltransferase involved in cell wall biosynthesis
VAKKQVHIAVSVTNDLVGDQRVHKICSFLNEHGFAVTLIGRKLPGSLPLERKYKTKRLVLLFKKGPLFYAFFNLRLFFVLLFRRTDVFLANDLDTLWPNYLVSKIKGCRLIYDSHEYFTEVPELISRPKVKAFWERLENRIFPKLKTVYTVNESLARVYEEKYKVPVKSVMNLPYYREKSKQAKNAKFTVIYQGVLNKDRGLEELVRAFEHLSGISLWVVGGGDIEKELKQLVKDLELEDKITFFGKVPFEKLAEITAQAHLGVSLEKGTNLNYRYATPNKVFDYIAAHLPLLTSDLPEIKKIVELYRAGLTLSQVDPKIIAKKIQWMHDHPAEMQEYSKNAADASKELCWEKQLAVLKEIFNVEEN